MLKRILFLALLFSAQMGAIAQLSPAVTNWLINTSGITGRHYISGNPTPITDTAQANVQLVRYSANNVYVNSSGIPAYIIGPYLDGNPALATNNSWLFKIPLNPTPNTGNAVSTPLGQIGVFINGVPMYDYKDGASYSAASGQDDMMNGDGVWNRNAIMAENDGFDCAKGHPSPIFSGPPGPGGTLEGGSYHHHQNPTAFNLDKITVSSICDMYLADGLYTLNETQHSPLIGYAFDGYPVYGAYGFSDANDATSAIKRIESSYQKRAITTRTHYADGTNVADGPAVSSNFPLGWYREDYEFVANSGDLDEHNGRFCVTPEYPNGTYAYFATVDENWNSAYPYLIGPTYYGVVETDNFTSGPGGGTSVQVNESTTTYNATTTTKTEVSDSFKATVFPNPASDVLGIQIHGLMKESASVQVFDISGKSVYSGTINQGSTLWYLDARTLYNGQYFVLIQNSSVQTTIPIVIQH